MIKQVVKINNVIGKRADHATERITIPQNLAAAEIGGYFEPLKHDFITKSSYSCAADIAIAYGLEYGSHCSVGVPVEGVVLYLLPALEGQLGQLQQPDPCVE